MIQIRVDDRQAKKFLRGMPKKIPWAMANALNATALRIYAAERRGMKQAFDRPTPWILGRSNKPTRGQGGMFIKYASARRNDLTCSIRFKNSFETSHAGSSAEKIMAPHIQGGPRSDKRGETHLKSVMATYGKTNYAPGSGLRLNKYGNVTKGMMTKIMSEARIHSKAGYSANRQDKSKKYFIHPNGSGIWMRTGKKSIRPVLNFIGKPYYRKRFDYWGIANRQTRRWLEHNTVKAIKSEINKMRFSNYGANVAR